MVNVNRKYFSIREVSILNTLPTQKKRRKKEKNNVHTLLHQPILILYMRFLKYQRTLIFSKSKLKRRKKKKRLLIGDLGQVFVSSISY